MAFEDRIVEHPGRVVLTPVTGETNTYDTDYTTAEGEVTQEGTLLNADSMNAAVQDLIDSSMNGISLSTGGTLSVRNIQSGSETFSNPTANSVVTKSITFLTSFENVPVVVVTPNTGAPQNCHVGVTNITTTGFTLNFYRTTSVTTAIKWIAVGM